MTDPLARLAHDLDDVAAHLADDAQPRRETASEVAEHLRHEVPVRSGALRNSVTTDDDGVTVTAVYAGVIAGGWPRRNIEANPYHERALSGADLDPIWTNHVDQALDELRRYYY